MPHGDRKRIEEVFQHALDLPPDQRGRYLDSGCGDDATLRSEVDKLLRVYAEGVVDAIRTPVLFVEEALPFDDELPAQIGRYKILRKIGEGGLGVVYEARQDNPNRLVALKIMRPGLLSEHLVRRFQREANVLGQLQHPGIAQIHDAGIAADSRQPFLAMELVRGRPLNEHAAAHRFSLREKLEVVAKICDAVQHAHDRGVIHRDLKPANLLVDESGQPKVLDFGVARVTASDLHTITLKTNVGQLIGTIPYMSPEQVSGDVAQLDVRSDVYALGVVMYELFSGRLPIDVQDRSIPEAIRLIREQDPTRLGSIDTSLRGEVDTIVAKAIEKDKTRRYQSAAELAANIRRYLHDEPIVARPASTFYQLRKFAKRNKALVAGVSATILLLATLAIRESWVRRDAQRIAYRAGMAAASAALRGHDCFGCRSQLEQVPRGLRGWEWRHVNSQLDDSAAMFQTDAGSIHPIGFRSDNGLVYALADRGEFHSSNSLMRSYELLALDLSAGRISGGRNVEALEALIGLDPNPGRIVFYSADRIAYAEDALTGADRRVLGTLGNIEAARPIASSEDNDRMLWFDAHEAVVIDTVTGERRSFSEGRPPTRCGAMDAGGSKIAYTVGRPDSADVDVLVWDVQNGRLLCEGRGHRDSIWKLAFSPDGSRLVSASMDYTIRQWPLEGSQPLRWETITEHANRVTALAFSPRGDRFATGSRDRTVRLWDSQTGESLGVFLGHVDEIQSLAFSADGSRLASGSPDGSIRIWELPRHGDPRVLLGHSSFVYAVAVSPDGTRIASGGWDGTIRTWDLESGDEIADWRTDGESKYSIVEGLSFHPQGNHLAICDRTRDWPVAQVRLRLVDADTGAESSEFQGTGKSFGLAFHPDGSLIALVGLSDQSLVLLERV